jgi:transmembrane 9 superfamily protein 2/4
VDKALNNVYLFNHVIIAGKVHKVEEDMHRIVGFEVKTRSINAERYTNTSDMGCKVKPSTTEDKSGALILDSKNMAEDELLTVQWSYSVSWEPSEIAWASRWDTYLQMDDAEIHWFSIINSLVTVLFLSGIIAFIMIRTLSRDIAKYNEEEEKDELFEQRGWKLVHGDVFRAPTRMGTLCVAAGSGIQLFCMLFVVILFSMFGMLSPANRGSLMTTAVFLYMFAGLFSGYFSGRLYRSMGGEDWMKQAIYTGLLFPSITFGTGFFLNFFIWHQGSSGALPFTTMLALLFLWFGVSLPLVVGGAYFGYRKDALEFPVNVNQIPRQIPEQLWYMHPVISVLLGGILPFGAVFIELFFILTAIWENQFYYLFGFLMLVFLILIISCSEIAIVMTYLQLCSEDYHWWWRSFLVSGGCAVYVFVYAIFYYVTKLEIEDPIAALVYFSYTMVMSLAFWLTTGTIGFLATLVFVWKIYGSVKID